MGLFERDHCTGFQRHDVDVHVVAHVARIDKARGAPAIIGARHPVDRLLALIGDKGRWDLDALDHFIALAHPMKPHRRGAGIGQAPLGGGRQEGIAAGRQHMRRPIDGDAGLALDDEQHALGFGVGLWFVAAAARQHFHDVLRERLGKARQRPRDHPGSRVGPVRQIGGDDVGHHSARDHRIGFGKHRPTGVEGCLRGQTSSGRCVGGSAHNAPGRKVAQLVLPQW